MRGRCAQRIALAGALVLVPACGSSGEAPHITVAFAVPDDQLEPLGREIRTQVPGDYDLDVIAVEHSEAGTLTATAAALRDELDVDVSVSPGTGPVLDGGEDSGVA